MSNEEKHALIEEKLFGQRWQTVDRIRINGVWCEGVTWIMPEWMTAENPGAGWHWGMKPPDYSSSLELCAKAERQLKAKLGSAFIVRYLDRLYCAVGLDVSIGSVRETWDLVTASAQCRTAAMFETIK